MLKGAPDTGHWVIANSPFPFGDQPHKLLFHPLFCSPSCPSFTQMESSPVSPPVSPQWCTLHRPSVRCTRRTPPARPPSRHPRRTGTSSSPAAWMRSGWRAPPAAREPQPVSRTAPGQPWLDGCAGQGRAHHQLGSMGARRLHEVLCDGRCA